eukprot:m.283765 g.283765  ORF g.283765 m.283765 type:complete len:443 (+) comp19420_c0_seq4:602-1930(+)
MAALSLSGLFGRTGSQANKQSQRKKTDMRSPGPTGPPSLTRHHWVPDSQALLCAYVTCECEFSLTDRRHHCRKCGQAFCTAHCSSKMRLCNSDDGLSVIHDPIRGQMATVCLSCFQHRETWQQSEGITRRLTQRFEARRRPRIKEMDTHMWEVFATKSQVVNAGSEKERRAALAQWVPDVSRTCCATCFQPFGMLRRRHHCRLCGNLFCAACCDQHALAAGDASEQAASRASGVAAEALDTGKRLVLRVCDGCLHLLGRRERLQALRTGREHPSLDLFFDLLATQSRLDGMLCEWQKLAVKAKACSNDNALARHALHEKEAAYARCERWVATESATTNETVNETQLAHALNQLKLANSDREKAAVVVENCEECLGKARKQQTAMKEKLDVAFREFDDLSKKALQLPIGNNTDRTLNQALRRWACLYLSQNKFGFVQQLVESQ